MPGRQARVLAPFSGIFTKRLFGCRAYGNWSSVSVPPDCAAQFSDSNNMKAPSPGLGGQRSCHAVCLLLVLFLWSTAAQSAVYYVNFDNGSDANSGTATSTAWKTLPGARKANNSGYVSTSFGGGVFTYNANKVPAGTTFKLKRGTTLDSTKGGWIQIDTLWYQNGTAGSPITIQADTNWGSGSIVINGTGMTMPTYRGLLNVNRIKYVIVDGMAESGIIITNAFYYGIQVYDSGTNGLVLRNLEVGNAPHAPVLVYSTDSVGPTYLSDIILDSLVVHNGTGTSDSESLIYLVWLNGFMVTNCIAYSSGLGSDCIHVGSSHEGWILNCTTHDGGEQGIDLSRDGDYKTRDDSYKITVRDCVSFDNTLNNFDHNSGTHHVYWINDVAWHTTSGQGGDACFNVHEGTVGINFWINCTSSKASDRGFNLGFENPWHNPAGTNAQYFINCLTSQDSNYSLFISEGMTNRCDLRVINCNFNSASGPTRNVVRDGTTIYTAANVTNGTGGWTGINCLSRDPQWVTNGSSWATTDLRLTSGSPCLNVGAFLFTTASGATNSTTLILTPLVADLDASRVFRAGDSLMVQGAGTIQVSSVSASNTIILSTPSTWQANKGVGFIHGGSGPPIGAFFGSVLGSPRNLHVLAPF